jgi:hypothetical protein
LKQAEILKILSLDLGTSSIDDVNKLLKAKDFAFKYRITGPTLVHYGFTGLIKKLTSDGVKIYNVNKVNLIRYDDIKTFAKAIPREERKGSFKTTAESKKEVISIELFDDDYDNDDDFDEVSDEVDDLIEGKNTETRFSAKKKRKVDSLGKKGTGSRFIPKKKN